jgi:glucosyl-3-phosphoglycerate synthase
VTNRDILRSGIRTIRRDACGVTNRAAQTTICIPAHNEAGTIAHVVTLARRAQAMQPHLVAEIVVIDDRSTDNTARRARRAGARVISTEDECRSFGGARGKGDAIWTALRRCDTELITFVDADVTHLDDQFVARLNEPLREHPHLHLVKGTFQRMGRVTTLTARPLLALLHPDLRAMTEPLSGVFAGRVETLGALWLDCDYGVDVGILLDVARQHGVHSVMEVDLGRLTHRNRDLESLSLTAEQVARAILARSTSTQLLHDDISVRRVPPRSGTVTYHL